MQAKTPADLRTRLIEAKWRDAGTLPGQLAIAPPPTASARDTLPDEWNIVHVMNRLQEAFEVIGRLPMTTRPRAYANSMPRYAYEQSDLIAQVETMELEKHMAARNRVVPRPSPAEIQRCEQALAWMTLIADDAIGSKREIRQAVGLGALWEARRVDAGYIKQSCKARGFSSRTFQRRKVQGLKLITMELIRRKVPVS
jgi:hypothetical protein